MPRDERRQAQGGRVLDEQHRPRSLAGTTLDLGDGRLHVPERNERLRDEPLGVCGAPLVEHPVVPGPHHREREVLVVRTEELSPAEAWERREQELGPHTVVVHRFHTLVHVVRGGDHVLVAAGVEVVTAAGFSPRNFLVWALPWKLSG